MNDLNLRLKLLGLFLLSFLLMSGVIDLDNLFNYSDSNIPDNIDSGIDKLWKESKAN